MRTASPTGEPGPGDRIGPYEVVRPVARGGMATVFAVRDTRPPHADVALKLLLPLANADEAKNRFRREFRALSRLQHPNVLQVFEWGLWGDRPWFTMELVEGRDLRDQVEVWKALEPTDRFVRVQAVLVQVARALAYIHDRGLVHRDVTPGNIMVRPDGVVKLMDFGVVKDLGTELTAVGEVVGTVAYISPEQISGSSVDQRADLYALGAVLYLMLTGRRPFAARTLQGYLDKHLNELPKPPHEVDPLVPPHLEQICLRLLEKKPEDRYASATHLLHVLGDLSGMDESEGRWPPRAVGRQLHRARIRESIDDLAAGKPGAAVLITGEPGMGKTRLVDMAESYARRLGLRVVRGRCRPHDRPFGPFVGIWRDLRAEGTSPVLDASFAGRDDGVVRERYPVIAAVRDLLVGRAPLVVLIDDLDRADPATIEVIEYLVRNTVGLARERVVYVLSEEAPAGELSPIDRALLQAATSEHGHALERLELEPLSEAEVEELCLSMLPNDAATFALARRLYAESDGSPAFIADMLRGLQEQGVLVRDGARFKLAIPADEVATSRLPMPASLRQALRARLAPLSAEALEVGRVLAIARRRMSFDEVVKASPLHEELVARAIDALVEAGIIDERIEDERDYVELSHQRLRDVLLEDLPPDDIRRRHQRVGEVLEREHRQRVGQVVEELAHHFERAGVASKAYAFLVQTGSKHLNRSLYEEALAFLDRAVRMEPTARPLMLLDDADRRLAEVHLARGQALYHLGNWAFALEEVRAAESLANDVGDARLQSRVLAELGNQLRGRGQTDEAEAALRKALQRAQEAGDPTLRPMPLYQLGALVWGMGDLVEAEKLWREALATAQRTGDERAMGYGYNGLGILAFCKGDSVEARKQLEQSAELFERLGMLGALSIARVNLVDLYLSTGILRKALALADRTVAQAREVHHPHGIALGLAYRAMVLLELSREEEAAVNAREALRIVRQLGTGEDEVLALAALVRVDLARDDAKTALVHLGELVPLLADYDSEGIAAQMAALHAQALAMLGRADEARAALRKAEQNERQWPHVQVRTDLARAIAWRMLGDPETARKILQRALGIAEANGFRFYQLVAQHELWQVVDDENARARHSRVAGALSRSLAASLSREDAERFLAAGWGGGAG